MEFAIWLLMQVRDRLWDEIQREGNAGATPRSQGTLDVIHVINEIITWAERTHYGDSGEILPVASVERQAFYDVLRVAVGNTIGALRDWDPADTDGIQRDMVTHAIALDTMASKVCAPYYVSQMMAIAALAPIPKEDMNDRPRHGTIVPNDGGQRGNDPSAD